MLHLMGGFQNSREHGGQFPPLLVLPPSTSGPEPMPTRSPGTTVHALINRDLRKAWELCCHASSDGGAPKQQRTWGAISTTPGSPPLYPWLEGRSDAQPRHLWGRSDIKVHQKGVGAVQTCCI